MDHDEIDPTTGRAGTPTEAPARGSEPDDPLVAPEAPGTGTGGTGTGRAVDDAVAGPRASRRPATALLTWGIVAIVLVIVIVLVVIKVTGTAVTSTGSTVPPTPAPSPVVKAVSTIPSSVYDDVGVTSPDAPITAPTLLSSTPLLKKGGLPEIVYVGDEFCPYCAAERWAIVAALSRFGTFSGLEASQSGTNEAFPGTPTFSFAGATYSSRYVAATLVEHYGDQKNAHGTGYAVLDRLTRTEQALMARYDRTQTGTVLPFLDIADQAVLDGGAFSPAILQQLSSTQIATGLTDPKDPATQAIVAASNEISAVICHADGEKPASVCSTAGVTAAATALGLDG